MELKKTSQTIIILNDDDAKQLIKELSSIDFNNTDHRNLYNIWINLSE